MADGADLFEISNLFDGPCSSLQRTETDYVGYSKLACSPFVNVKINYMENFLEQSKL